MDELYEFSNKMDLFAEATITGFKNILSNQTALILIGIALVGIFLLGRLFGKVRWLIILAIAGGYGSVLLDGLKKIALSLGIQTDNIISMVLELIQSIT